MKTKEAKTSIGRVVDGHRILKSLSGESVLKGNPCKQEFDKYVEQIGFYAEPVDSTVECVILDNPTWTSWLTSNGYIENTCSGKTFESGMFFSIDDEWYVLSVAYDGKSLRGNWCWRLVCLVDGLVWSDPCFTIDNSLSMSNLEDLLSRSGEEFYDFVDSCISDFDEFKAMIKR